MTKILKKLNVLLDKKQKKIMASLILVMLIGAALELLGVGLIYEVATVITDPNVLEKRSSLALVYEKLNMESMTQFSIVIMGLLILVFAVKNAYLFFQNKVQIGRAHV